MYEFPLTGAQKTYLRGLGQKLEPALKVGKSGLTPEFYRELQRALDGAELIKLRFLGADRDERSALCEEIADKGRSICVGSVGHVALFFRQNADPKRRVVTLPE
jgi:RNA-binding protein